MSSSHGQKAPNQPQATRTVEHDWVSVSSTPPLYPVSITYGTPQPASSPTNQAHFVYPSAAPQSPYTYPSLPQYASQPHAYPGGYSSKANGAAPPTHFAASVVTHIVSHPSGDPRKPASSYTQTDSRALPPSYGLATAYNAHRNNSPVASANLNGSAATPSLQASYQAPVPLTRPNYDNRSNGSQYPQLYPGMVYVPPVTPQLPGKQQYLHKGANAVPVVYYNPYTTSNPYANVQRSAYASSVAQSGYLPANAAQQPQFPQFSGDSKVQVGASHLAASKAQDEYMRQIKALQSFYGYSSTSSLDQEYAAPLSATQARQTAETTSEKKVLLTQSVDILLASGSRDAFIEEQERILREFNAKKAETEAHKKATEASAFPATTGVLVEDEEAYFDELLRSENPNASVSYPLLVVPELVEALDEKLENRIANAQAFSRRARGFAHLNNLLWNLAYNLNRFKPAEAPKKPETQNKKENQRRSYLVSSKGRREPLEESVGRDWQLLDDLSAIHGNSQPEELFSPFPAKETGRFLYPTNMVTFDNPMAFSVRPAQVAKHDELEKLLYSDHVELLQLQSFCLGYGILRSARAFVWQLMLGYIPARASERAKEVLARRIEYFDYFDKYLSEKSVLTKQDRTMYNLVLVDAPRTHPDGYHALFSKPCVQASLERILYLWARNHPETSYYQGLNDLASIVLVVFLECCLPDFADLGTPAGQEDLMDHLGLPAFESSFLASPQCTEMLESALFCVEADAYHCLTLILDRVREYHFFSSGGVYSESMIVHFEELVKRADPELHAHLISNDLMFIQFAFRWMLCFFTRELETRNLICLWDSYIVEQLGFPLFHIYVCASYLIELRKQLLGCDMISMMGFLQRAPTGHFTKHDVHRLVQNAADLAMRFPLNIKPIEKRNQ